MDAIEALHNRVSSPLLKEPAPTPEQVQTLLKAAIRAPDHKMLKPWRFIIIEGQGRERFGDLLAKAAKEKDPQIDEEALTKASTLVSNNAAIAIVDMPKADLPNMNGLILALDGVSDPGNLGTIIRVADWYGIKHIVTSTDSADAYNPKTISATMGSFVRVSVSQVELPEYLQTLNLPIYGAFLDGESVHKTQFSGEGVLLMGSESHGIREACAGLVTDKITIPAFGEAESLNVAMATGIILDNFKRQA